jgi:hypothetical protein
MRIFEDNPDTIKRELKAGEIEYLDAIERLQKLGFQPKDAEDLVDRWTS